MANGQTDLRDVDYLTAKSEHGQVVRVQKVHTLALILPMRMILPAFLSSMSRAASRAQNNAP